MKKIIFSLLLLSVAPAIAQTEQSINKNTGITLNPISAIDSIRFDVNNGMMEVVFSNGSSDAHFIPEIVNVNFEEHSDAASDPTAATCGTCGVHNANLTYGSLTDQDFNVYKTIQIGTQEWMAENLLTQHYQNGDEIPWVYEQVIWDGLTTGAMCNMYNNGAFWCPFGHLYNWYAVADPRNVCPVGWHVPTDSDWVMLFEYLDPGAETSALLWPIEADNIAGTKMKSEAIFAATNESGFSALFGGWRNQMTGGDFSGFGSFGQWWSSTLYDSNRAWYVYTSSASDAVRSIYTKGFGNSVRCIRD